MCHKMLELRPPYTFRFVNLSRWVVHITCWRVPYPVSLQFIPKQKSQAPSTHHFGDLEQAGHSFTVPSVEDDSRGGCGSRSARHCHRVRHLQKTNI